MKVLVWQWGRFGAGPRVAAELAGGLRAVPGVEVVLSLSRRAELLSVAHAPHCAMPVETYDSAIGYVWRMAMGPLVMRGVLRSLRRHRPDLAICAMPGPMDLVMRAALERAGIPCLVVVHDADRHPGDGYPFQMALQRRLIRGSDALIALTRYIGDRLRAQGVTQPILLASLPPFGLDGPVGPPGQHGGPLRLLSFGRLLPYKGLDLLAAAMTQLGVREDIALRVVGSGPESSELEALRALPNVTVENRWVPEDEVAALIDWSDALVLPYREASQSGVAALAIAARRRVIATRVGGLSEQFEGETLALMCEPRPDSIRARIEELVEQPCSGGHQAFDAREAWRAMATGLVKQIEATVRTLPGRR